MMRASFENCVEEAKRAKKAKRQAFLPFLPFFSFLLPPRLSSRDLSHDHHRNAALARLIPLDQENPLPATQLEHSVGDIDADRDWQEKGFAMRMAVGRFIGWDVDAAAEIVVLVLGRTRRQAF